MNSEMIAQTLRVNREPYGGGNIFEELDILIEEILPGVVCPRCQVPSMKEQDNGGWFCEQCHTFDGSAHIDSLVEYCLLIDQYISIDQTQWFLQLDTPSNAYQILESLYLEITETEKGRMYDLKPLMKDEYFAMKDFKKEVGKLF
ncbi:hypothetical protein CEY16_08380 [Halalkalibacillus sediminis]|uniref:Uncharacterized protein n=1 Tax=Halalkalibacillus sediminis TaxID=2018042 RepID=A0A2I0QUB7_9BACI|nr:hypothetical protein [Halalkalibacillus sediminis]PKR77931.1 hypothetical protein CEY16_08380 [Halalkalibacillus sediminis]